MDKKILFFCLAVLTACGLLVRGLKIPAAAAVPAPPAAAQIVATSGSIDSPPSVVAPPSASSASKLGTPVLMATAAPTEDSSPEAMLAQMQAETAAKQAELNRWRAWAARDLKDALAALATIPNDPDRGQIVQAICVDQIKTNPALAVELAQSLQSCTSVVEDLVQQWAQTDSAAAFAWSSAQPAGFERDRLMDGVATVLSRTEPEQAASLVVDQISPGPLRNQTVMTVAYQWGLQNLAAAAAWVKTFPPGPLQASATEELEGVAQMTQNRPPVATP